MEEAFREIKSGKVGHRHRYRKKRGEKTIRTRSQGMNGGSSTGFADEEKNVI